MLPVVVGSLAFVVTATAMRYLRRPLRRHRFTIVQTATTAAAVIAVFDDAAPTGAYGVDMLLRIVLAGLVTAAASEAAYGWVTAGVAFLAIGAWAANGDIGSFVAVAVAVAAVLPIVGAGNRGLQSVAAGFAVVGLLRLDAGPQASLVVGIPTVALLAVPALRRVGRVARRRVLVGAALAVVFAGAMGALALVAMNGAEDDLREAADLATEGLDLLGEDDAIAAALLEGAAIRFERAGDRLGSWWVLPGRAVPVVAQHLRAASTLADAGSRLSSAATTTLDEVGLTDLRIVDGRVDVGVIRTAAVQAREVAAALDRTFVDLLSVASPWLVDTLAGPVEDVTERLAGAADAAQTATTVADVLPALLGGDGPRSYLLIAQNLNEAEGSGGFPGNWGQIDAVDGTVDLVRSGRLDELNGIRGEARPLALSQEVVNLFAGGDSRWMSWQNSMINPQFAESAAVVRQLYEQSGGPRVDGVIAVDPVALDAILELTGPLRLPEAGVQLEPGSAAKLFLYDQYVEFDRRDERGQRIDLLDEAIDVVFDAVTAGDLGTGRQLLDVLADAAAGEHIQVASFDDREQAALERAGLDGGLPVAPSDGVGAVVHQGSLNKMDWFVDRDSRYEARWDPRTGAVASTYSFRLANRAPATGLPDALIRWGGGDDDPRRTAPGEWAGNVYVYSRLEPTVVRVDGVAVGRTVLRHLGWYVTFVDLHVPSGGTGRIDVDFDGAVPVGSYGLDVVRQASINGDDFSALLEVVGDTDDLEPGPGVTRLDEQTFAASGRLDRPFRIDIFGTN